MKRLIKIFAFLAAGFLILILAAAVFIRLKFPPEKIKAQAASLISEKIGLSVKLGDVGLSIFGIRVNEIVVSQAEGFGKKPLLTVKSLSVLPRLIPLLKGEIWLNKISLEAADANLFRNAKGIWNFSSQVHPGPFPFDQNLPKPFSLQAKNLSAEMNNLSKDRPFLFGLSSDIAAQGYSFSIQGESIVNLPQETIHIKALKLNFPQGDLKLSGNLKGLRLPDGPQMDIRLQGERLALEGLSKLLSLPKGLTLSGAPLLDLHLRGNKNRLTIEGNLGLKKSSIGYGEYFLKPQGTEAQMKISLFWFDPKLTLKSFALTMGQVSIKGNGEISQKAKSARMDLSLELPQVSMASLQALSPWLKKVNAEGNLKADAKIIGLLQAPQVTATLTLSKGSLVTTEISVSGAEGRLSVAGKKISGNAKISQTAYGGYTASDISGGMIYEKDRLSFNSLSCRFYGGVVSGKLSLGARDMAHTSYETEVTAKDVDIAKLLTASKKQNQGKISGIFSGKLKLKGVAAAWDSLSGSGEASLRPLKLEEMSFGKGLAESFNIQELKNLSFENASCKFSLNSGVLKLEKFETQGGDRLDLTGTGQAHLATKTYDNLSGEVKLAKAHSGGDLAKYTGDAEGRVTAPYTLGGTFENPRFKIHWEKMAGKALQRAAEEVIQKEGGKIGGEVEKIFRGIFGK